VYTGDSIVNPLKGKNAPELGPVAVMVSSQDDLLVLVGLLNLNKRKRRSFFTSRLFYNKEDLAGVSVVGPIIGAPYAVMLLENLVAWGARKIIFFGWCGAVSHEVKIGDIIVPKGAIIDEGTSKHYIDGPNSLAYPADQMLEKTKKNLTEQYLTYHEGLIWTTDAVYRETRSKVEHFQKKGALAVEMELSALFTVGNYRNAEVSGILVVSDELSTLTWRPGFKDSAFKKGRRAVAEVISTLCRKV
jgi:purine-nucleoside phosphorylase